MSVIKQGICLLFYLSKIGFGRLAKSLQKGIKLGVFMQVLGGGNRFGRSLLNPQVQICNNCLKALVFFANGDEHLKEFLAAELPQIPFVHFARQKNNLPVILGNFVAIFV